MIKRKKEKIRKIEIVLLGLCGLIGFACYKTYIHNRQRPKTCIEGIVVSDSITVNGHHGVNYAFTIKTKDGGFKSFKVFDADNALDSRINSMYQVGIEVYESKQDRSYFEIWRSQIKYIHINGER